MHRRFLIIVAIVAFVVLAGVTVGLSVARAQGEPELATITPAQLLANVAQHAGDVAAVSGDVSWKNDVLGLSLFSFGGKGSGDLTALLSGGSGRIWVQDGQARFEIQGAIGDTTIVADSTSVWVYTYTSNTATEYVLPAGATGTEEGTGEGPGTQSPQTAVADPVAAIDALIQNLAPDATLAVSDQVNVAGRSCYVLSLVPKATNTIFGSVQVAVDGETYLPLKIDVYAKGTTEPVLTAGFTSVSYSELADSTFAFTPPPNAKVEHKTLTLPAEMTDGSDAGPAVEPDSASDHSLSTHEKAPLTLEEAATKAGFTPPAAQTTDSALAFGGAYVIPARELDLQSLLDQFHSGALGSAMLGFGEPGSSSDAPSPSAATTPTQPLPPSLMSGPITVGPTVVQRYGQGFGTIVLIEAKVPAESTQSLEQMLASVPLLSRTTTGAVTIYQFNTALGSIALWNKDGILFMAAGSVSQTDLTGFIAVVR